MMKLLMGSQRALCLSKMTVSRWRTGCWGAACRATGYSARASGLRAAATRRCGAGWRRSRCDCERTRTRADEWATTLSSACRRATRTSCGATRTWRGSATSRAERASSSCEQPPPFRPSSLRKSCGIRSLRFGWRRWIRPSVTAGTRTRARCVLASSTRRCRRAPRPSSFSIREGRTGLSLTACGRAQRPFRPTRIACTT
mmetsp:Transcript_7223/g.15757  ORF Transcript_7223/g.15757 Transcript_7223/m.15757 type:complete len:200 (-) Transcript_7223:419-1018(-)